MGNNGWIKLHRQIFENHFLMQDDTCFTLFMKLLVTVGKNKGEVSGGRKQLAKQYNMSEYVFYRAINRLCKEGMVHKESHKLYTVYSICNWHQYQESPAQDSAPHPHSTRTAPAHSNKNKNKKKNIYTGLDIEDLEPELSEFIKMRTLIKSPMTDLAIKRLVTRVRGMYPDDITKQRAVLLQAIDKGWKDVYPLKDVEKRFA